MLKIILICFLNNFINYFLIVLFFILYFKFKSIRNITNKYIKIFFTYLIYNLIEYTMQIDENITDIFEYFKKLIIKYRKFIENSNLKIDSELMKNNLIKPFKTDDISQIDVYLTILGLIKIYKEYTSNNNEFDVERMFNEYVKKYVKDKEITDKEKNKFITYHKLFHYLISKYIKEDEIKKLIGLQELFMNQLNDLVKKFKNI